MSTKSLTGASVSAIILSILQDGDSYGYAIIQKVRSLSGGEVEWAAGSLYPVLHRMKTNGWIEDYWVDHDGERRRRFYRITKKGVRALEREKKKWMTVHGVLAQLWDLQPVKIPGK
jgi:DNA-binding PadR family transcriptional regulator